MYVHKCNKYRLLIRLRSRVDLRAFVAPRQCEGGDALATAGKLRRYFDREKAEMKRMQNATA